MGKTFVRGKENYSLAEKVKRKGTLLTLFRPPGYSNHLPPPLVIFYKNFQPFCLLEPPVYSGPYSNL